jgi:hypothetical protein
VTNVFNFCETQFYFPGVDSNVLIEQAIKHTTCVIKKFWIRLAMDEYIVDVDLVYFIDQAVKDLVLHSALKVRASSFQSHGNSVPLVETPSRSESGEFALRWV